MSLRWKIVLTVAVSIVVSVLTCGLILRFFIASAEHDRMRVRAGEQLSSAAQLYTETGLLTLNARIADPELPEELAEKATTGEAVTTFVTVDGQEQLWVASRVAVGSREEIISIRTSTEASQQMLRRVDLGIVLGLAVPGIALTIISSLIANRITRRITQGASAARRIAQGDSTIKISEEIDDLHDEVSDLAEAVDRAVDRLRDRIASEQRFTADLAHELRTPLTGLINAASLLDDSRPAFLVRDRIQRLQTLVEDLLEVSRLEGGKVELQFSRVVVDHTVPSLVRRLLTTTALSEHQVRVFTAAPGVEMETDLRRLERILTNILLNAAKHGGDPIVISTSPEAITVIDHGSGYPADILSDGPSRYLSSGHGGMGLGLVIAMGQARALGMQVRFGRAPTGGARTDVLLPDQFLSRR